MLYTTFKPISSLLFGRGAICFSHRCQRNILIVVKFYMSSHLHCSSGQNFVDINLGDKKLIYGVLKEFQYMMF